MRISNLVLVCAAAILSPTLCIAAQDEEKKESPLPSHLPLKTEVCFGRTYDTAHLAAHPKQRVTSFHLSREFKPDLNLEFEQTSEQEMKDYDGANSSIGVSAYVRFRDRKGVYTNGLSCHKYEKNRVRCGVDCDGGSFDLKVSGQSILLENQGFVVVGGCGASEDEQESEEHVSPGTDDKVFRLDPKPVAACVAERAAMAPAWVKLGKPLRFRFTENETLCLSKSYDAAHLASHPKQMIKRIAIFKTKDWIVDGQHELLFQIETRDGKKFEQKADCSPDQYAFGCQQQGPIDVDRSFYLTRAGENDVMLRDKHGLLEKVFKTRLGSDDRIFKLKASPAEMCAR